jgi:predicted homoserine dehydrogenase-like protein
MAAGQQLACDVAAGAIVTRQMICPPAQSELFRLRDEMDKWLYSKSR